MGQCSNSAHGSDLHQSQSGLQRTADIMLSQGKQSSNHLFSAPALSITFLASASQPAKQIPNLISSDKHCLLETPGKSSKVRSQNRVRGTNQVRAKSSPCSCTPK